MTFEIGVSSSAKTKTVVRPYLKRRVRELDGMSSFAWMVLDEGCNVYTDSSYYHLVIGFGPCEKS